MNKRDEAILGPALIVQCRTEGIQVSPSSSYQDATPRNAAAYQGLFDPIGVSLGECKIANQFAPPRCVAVDVTTHVPMIL